MASSSFKKIINPKNTPIDPNTSILTDDINIISKELRPGGAGLLRCWFTFDFDGAVDAVVSISTKPAFADPEKLNPDQEFVIKSGGKYRFDIDIEEGDTINIQSSVKIIKILKLRFHKIVFGA